MVRTAINFIFIAALSCLISCEKNEERSREQDESKLKELYQEIKALTASSTCTSSDKLGLKPLGSKACGGPYEFIVYSSSIDTVLLIDKVEVYTEMQTAYNKKYNIISNCSTPIQPKSIICKDGKPIPLY